jgi:hypothetical protein
VGFGGGGAPQLFARRELLRRRVPRLSESAATTQHHLSLRRTFVVGDGDDKEVVQAPAAATLTLSGAAGTMLQVCIDAIGGVYGWANITSLFQRVALSEE